MSYSESAGKTPRKAVSSHKDCAYGLKGKEFTSSPSTTAQRKHGHLERPPSQELAVGIPGKASKS